jgi:hypothetical protein
VKPIGNPYTPLSAGGQLWHVYKDPHAANSFNPHSSGRFAGQSAVPPRAMYYAASTSDCALWETLLRDVVPQVLPPHDVELPPVAEYHLARLRFRTELAIVDLRPLALRWLVGADAALRDRLVMLTSVPKYTATHKAAAELLAGLPYATGLRWSSKQTDQDEAYVFYAPPAVSDDLEILESIALDSPAGQRLLDQALARAGMRRLASLELDTELAREIPKDLEP